MSIKKPTYQELEIKVKKLEDEAEKGRQAEARLKKTKLALGDMKKLYDESLKNRGMLERKVSAIRSKVNMPELFLNDTWKIVGYSSDFPVLTKKVAEFAEKKKSLREFLRKGDFELIQQYLDKVEAMEKLPYDEGKEWKLRYKGPKTGDRTGKQWIVSAYCSEKHWEIRNDGGRLKIFHRPHIRDETDCYLMSAAEYGSADEDLKLVCRVKTSAKAENIRDLSVVICGTSGREETLPDLHGYTACSGSNYNTEGRLQRQAVNMAVIPEKLDPDTEYRINMERTGGRLRRLLENLRTGREAPVLEFIDTNAIYGRQNHVGFATFSGELEVCEIEIYTRKSRFGIEQFRIPFDVEAGIKEGELEGKVFKLRLGRDESSGRSLNTLMFEDITEQKRTEEALRKSEASLAEAQRIARLGI